MSNTPPCNRVKILDCLGYVHYILLFPATFYLLNAAMGIMHKKFGPFCNIMPCKCTPDERLGTLLFIIHEVILAYLVISSYQGLLGQKNHSSLSLVVKEAGKKMGSP